MIRGHLTRFLGEIPLDPAIRSSGDSGKPVATGSKDHPSTAAFLGLADAVSGALDGAEGAADWAAKVGPGEV